MKICERHFEALQAGIKARGLWDFVVLPAKNEVVPFGEHGDRPVDPLMFALSMVYGEAIRIVLLNGDPAGLFHADVNVTPHLACPICHLNYLQESHDSVCNDPRCPKGIRYEGILENAAVCAQNLLETLSRK